MNFEMSNTSTYSSIISMFFGVRVVVLNEGEVIRWCTKYVDISKKAARPLSVASCCVAAAVWKLK